MRYTPALIVHHPSSPQPTLSDSPRLREFQPVEHDDDFSRIGQLAVPPPPQHAATVPERAGEPTAEQWEELAVKEGLFALIRKYGAPRVAKWVRNLAAMAGQDVNDERPSHLCLADGAALKNNRCVQCGRDNS
jgi:hypothetical protein